MAVAGAAPRPIIRDEEPERETISPYSASWALYEAAENRYLGQELVLADAAPYFRAADGVKAVDESGQQLYGFRLERAAGARRVRVVAISVDTRGSLEQPTLHLRFLDQGTSCWVRAEHCAWPLQPAVRGRLSPLAARSA